MSNQSSDKKLVKRVQRGDKGAFDLLVLKYQHKIVNLVMRYVRDPELALDITQEAFIKAYRALPRFRGDSAFYTWMYRIAVNTAKNHLAAQRRRPMNVELDAAARRYFTVTDLSERVSEWCGLRPCTPDGLPVIGRVPGYSGAYVSTGHAMLGLTLGPVTGSLIADLVIGGTASLGIEAFRPGRFSRN